MMDKTAAAIAEDMIAAFGVEEAWAMANARLIGRLCIGDRIGADFWARIGSTIWAMNRESLSEPTSVAA
jgi:hypothetical protein